MFTFRKIKKNIDFAKWKYKKTREIGEIRGKFPLFSCQHNEPML